MVFFNISARQSRFLTCVCVCSCVLYAYEEKWLLSIGFVYVCTFDFALFFVHAIHISRKSVQQSFYRINLYACVNCNVKRNDRHPRYPHCSIPVQRVYIEAQRIKERQVFCLLRSEIYRCDALMNESRSRDIEYSSSSSSRVKVIW